MPDKIALEGFSFTATEGEAAAIYLLLQEEGFEPNSKGLKAYLLHAAGAAPGGMDEDEPAEDERAELSESVRRILEAAERNPEVTQYAIKKGAQFLGTLLKRLG